MITMPQSKKPFAPKTFSWDSIKNNLSYVLKDIGSDTIFEARRCSTSVVDSISDFSYDLDTSHAKGLIDNIDYHDLHADVDRAKDTFTGKCLCMPKEYGLIKSIRQAEENPEFHKLLAQIDLLNDKAKNCADNFDEIENYMQWRIDQYIDRGYLNTKQKTEVRDYHKRVKDLYNRRCK